MRKIAILLVVVLTVTFSFQASEVEVHATGLELVVGELLYDLLLSIVITTAGQAFVDEMVAKGVTVEIIRDYLGHSDIKTTWGYIFDNNEEERTAKIISDSLMDMNSLRIS